MPTTSQVDAWVAQCSKAIVMSRNAVLDVIDVGATPDAYPTGHKPTETEIRQTDRKDGMFRSTPVSGSRRSGVSNPTAGAVIAAEGAAQAATTALLSLCNDGRELVDQFSLTVTDEHGTILPLRMPKQRFIEETYTRPARMVVDEAPADCRRWATQAAGWLQAVTDAMGHEWAQSGEDRATGHADWWKGRCVNVAKRLGSGPVPQQPELVYCQNHPDTLAKYRKREMCEPCYREDRKQSEAA